MLRCLHQCTNGVNDFLVSTAVLRLASPVFSCMFGASFNEGQRLHSEICPVFELHDDDPAVMELILRVLHHQSSPEDYLIDAEKLARLSVYCDKYDCTRALRAWIRIWLQTVKTMDASVEALGFQIMAAYMFGNPLEFREISRAATLQLPLISAATWERDERFELLPTSVTGKQQNFSEWMYSH